MSCKSVLFVDFDNLIIGLSETDPTAAVSFAADPAGWLTQLLDLMVDEEARRWLVRRCYLNPNGFIHDQKRLDDQGRPFRIYFSRLRPLLTSAGFEVIDCPALTARGKNAADIRIVLDVVDSLEATVRYDEFVIVSSDSDFTPLMHRLRAADRRVVAVAAETSSSAYLSVVDRVLTTGDLLGLINATDDEADADAGAFKADRQLHVGVASGDGSSVASREDFEGFLRDAYARAEAPLNLAALGNAVRDALGEIPLDYYGAGTFTAAVQRLDLEGAMLAQHHVWDPDRHKQPTSATRDDRDGQSARQVSAVTGLPRLATGEWAALFDVLAAYAATQEWNLTESTKWTRDQLAAQGKPVGRGAIGFVVRQLSQSPAPLNRDPAPTSQEIAHALFLAIVSRAEEAGLRLSDEESRELAAWLSVPGDGPRTT